MSACHRGRLEAAKALLRSGADPNWMNYNGDLTLFWAIDGRASRIMLLPRVNPCLLSYDMPPCHSYCIDPSHVEYCVTMCRGKYCACGHSSRLHPSFVELRATHIHTDTLHTHHSPHTTHHSPALTPHSVGPW